MKIAFVTRNQYQPTEDIAILSPQEGRALFESWDHYQELAHDTETTGENPHTRKMLTEQWYPGDPTQPVLVIDCRSIETGEVVRNEDLEERIIIAHNANFECRWNLKRGLDAGEYYCTMVADQVIMSGSTGIKFDIISVLERRGCEKPPGMDKAIRNDFIGAGDNFVLQPRHLIYAAGDCIRLHQIKNSQQILIESLKINFLIHRLRMPLVKVLAKTELTGFTHDTESWIRIARDREEKAVRIRAELDNYLTSKGIDILSINTTLKKLYDQQDKTKSTLFQRGIKIITKLRDLKHKKRTDTKAYRVLTESLSKIRKTPKKNLPLPTINWSSPQQPLAAMKLLEIVPLPIAKDQKTYRDKEGVGKAARANWFVAVDSHEHMEFMKKFDKLKKLDHNIKSFGEEWVKNYLNPITHKVHTCFRQAGTKTLRFASGDKRKSYFNLQQIPKETRKIFDVVKNKEVEHAEYRECFGTDPGRMIGTFDYTGCEVVCMVSLSGDLDLKKITDLPDQHSYMGTKCWRAIYTDRYLRTGDPKWKELSESYVMDKYNDPKGRDKFKQSGIFPVIYGVKPPKVAGIQGFTEHEGQIFITTIEGSMPKVVTYVKECAKHAVTHGFVLHNTRTNSRRWFQAVLSGEELSRKEIAKIETAARNSPVQGTNVDIIVEAIITIARWARLYNLDIRLLGQVHDELIYDFPVSYGSWVVEKIKSLMRMVAKRYLIPEIDMDVDSRLGYVWLKEQI